VRDSGNDPYLIRGTEVLENKLGIRDTKELERVERLLTADRLAELTLKPLAGDFDLGHLQRIHRAIFQDIYDWAGDLREINVAKGAIRFAMTSHLESSAAEIFGRLARENHLQGLTHGDFARLAADYLADVNALHPFREGNGRTQREFFRELAARAGFHLDWSRTNSKDMVRASLAGMVGDAKGFVRIFKHVARPLGERDVDFPDRKAEARGRERLADPERGRHRDR
jgi:cell filamentation protein